MKYNSIGEQLVAKAKEIDPSYKPDKFNDMSEAIDVILKNSGSAGTEHVNKTWYKLDTYSGKITQGQYDEISALVESNQLAGVIISIPNLVTWFLVLSGITNNNDLCFSLIDVGVMTDVYTRKSIDDITFYIHPDLSVNLDWNSHYFIEAKNNFDSQVIPSIINTNDQQNLIIGNGLTIQGNSLNVNLETTKCGCIKLNNIKVGESKYSIHVYLLDFLYDRIIEGAADIFSTTLTRESFPDFVKTNITKELFIKLISTIVKLNQDYHSMPYLDFEYIDPIGNYFHNCSFMKAYDGSMAFLCTNDHYVILDNVTFEDDFSLEYEFSTII